MCRRFSGEFLPARREALNASIDRDVALRWVRGAFPERWGESTRVQFPSKLLSASAEAELVSTAPDPRKLSLPRVPDEALAYLLLPLRGCASKAASTTTPICARWASRGPPSTSGFEA